MENVRVIEICEDYCGNDMRKVVQICYPILKKIGGIYESDYNDFYSIANNVVWIAAKNFDETQNDNFDVFLRGCIERKFKTEMTRRNRDRRIPTKHIDSLDRPLSDESDLSFGDTIKGSFDLNEELYELSEESRIDNYLNSLTETQKKIARLILNGYELHEIKKILGLSNDKFDRLLNKMRSLDKRILLRK